VALLDGIAAAKRRPAAAVHELAADIEVLLEHNDRSPEVACAHRGMQPDTAGAEDDDIRLIIPLNALRGFLRQRRSRQDRHANAGGGSAREEIAPADRFFLRKLGFLINAVALLGHV